MTTLNLQPDATAGKDSYIISSSPDNNAEGSNIHLGGNSDARRCVIYFDFSAILAGSIINLATFSLYFYDYTNGGTRTIKIYRLKRVWVENQVTWNEYATGSSWQTPGATGANDYDSTEVASLAVTDTYPAWQAWTLSPSLVQEMIPGGAFGNYGFLLIDTTESGNVKLFRSSDDGGGTLNPKLDIDYTAPAALISGSTCWGHVTGVAEANTRTFASNWTGTGDIGSSGDGETICLNAGEYMESEVVNTGIKTVELDQNHYSAGDAIKLRYRHGATSVDCLAASYSDYTVPFLSLGYVQVRVESTL